MNLLPLLRRGGRAAALAALLAAPAAADSPPAAPRELWVPDTEVPALLKARPRAVLLTREQYETLQRDARPDAKPPAEAAPAPVILRSLHLTAEPAGPIVIAKAEFKIDVLSDKPAALPLDFTPAVLAGLELDDAASLAVTDKSGPPAALLPPGAHTLRATLHLPVAVSAAGRTIAVRGAPAGAASFTLTLPAADHIDSALTWSTAPGAEGMAVHTFILPPGDRPHAITWSTRDIRDLPGTALTQSCHYVFYADSVRLHGDLAMQFRSRLAAMAGSLTIPVPPEGRVLSIDGADVREWTVSPDKTSATVTLTPQPDRHEAAFTVSLDLPLPAADPAKSGARAVSLPFLQAAGVHRASGRFVMITEGDLRVRRVTPPPLAVQSTPTPADRELYTGDLAGIWDFAVISGSPAVELEDLAPVFHATQDTQIDLERDAIHLTRHLEIVPRQGRLFAVSLTLPPGEDLKSLTLRDGTAPDWRKLPGDPAKGTAYELRFPSGLQPGTSPALVLKSRLDPPQWTSLTESGAEVNFGRAAVTGADRISGFIAVSAGDRFALTTGAASGLEQRDPATLGDDVPVRGGLVWFAPGDFRLPLRVSARRPEFDAVLSAFVLPLLHTLEIEGVLDLDVRESGLRQLTLQLPAAAAPHLRFDSPLVSGTRFDAPAGEWTVTFREELRGPQSLRWRMALPVASGTIPNNAAPDILREFAADVPVIKIPAARRLTARWIMEANTDTELTFDTAGLDERDTLTLPQVEGYAPRHRVIAAWDARGTDWRLRLTAKRHQPATLPPLVVDRCALTSSVSPDGTVRHTAVLSVRSNGQQFLDLPLAGETRILTLLVNGEPQKPAASGSASLRAQLPAGLTRPVTVSLTWEAEGEPWTSGGTRKLEALRLPDDLPVLVSHWTLRLPDGYVYTDFQSDMQRENGPTPPRLDLSGAIGLMAGEKSASRESSADRATAAAAARPPSAEPVSFLEGGGGGVAFRINRQSAPDIFETVARDQVVTASGSWLNNQTRVLKSPEVLRSVVRKLALDTSWDLGTEEAASKLEQLLQIDADGDTVRVRADTGDPGESERIARAVMDGYADRRRAVDEERVRRLGDTMASQIKSQEESVEKARLEMLEVMKKHGIVDLYAIPDAPGPSSVLTPDGEGIKGALDRAAALRREVENLTRNAEFLADISGEHLFRRFLELGVDNPTVRKFYPEYQSEMAALAELIKSGLGPDHPKVTELKSLIAGKQREMEAAIANYRTNLTVQIAQSKQLLESAQQNLSNLELTSSNALREQAEYATSKNAYESQVQLLNSIREHAGKLETETAAPKKSAGEKTKSDGRETVSRGVAGLLPLDIALPAAGREFRFRGYQAPGAITFAVRDFEEESHRAWLWIAAGLGAALLAARRRPVFYGLLVALLLGLIPWIVGAGMGPCHRLLIGWGIGCGFLLSIRILTRIRGPQPAAVPASAATALLAALLAGLTASPVRADEAPAEEPTVIVPYDAEKPLSEQKPQQVYIDYARFQKLWQEARDQRLARNAPAAAALTEKSGHILSALYDATIAGGTLKIEAILTVHTTGRWATVSLQSDDQLPAFGGASLAGLTMDGAAAALNGQSLLVENPGRHLVRATLQAPLTGDWRQFEMRVPRAAASVISLSHADPSLRLRLNGGIPLEVSEKREGGYQWRGTGAAGSAVSIRLERLPAVLLAAGSEKPPLGAVRARVFATPAIERLDARIDYQFAGSERRDFAFAWDPTLTPVQIDIPNLESWSVRESDGRRLLEFRLSVPARDRLTAGFLAERPATAGQGAEHTAPALVPVSNRQEYTVEVLTSDDMDLTLRPAGGWARSELAGMGDAAETGFRSAGAYRLAGAWSPLTWTADARPLRRSVQADYAWKIAGGIIETTVTFTLRAGEHEDLTALTIPLPAGAALQTLDGDRLRDWWRDGDALELRFSGATAETTTVWLDFTQPVTDEQMKAGLPLPCLVLAGFDDVKGRGVLATGPESDLRLRIEDKPVFVREVAAEQARGDYTFLPPFRLRRGFTFEAPVFHVFALPEPVPPAFAARWVLGAAVQDSWTETQFRIDIEVRQGALTDLRFVMPAGLPEARVTGETVRESVRTALADGRSEYRVTFQSPVAGTAALVAAVELPHKGRLTLPDIDFPGAALTERFLIMQNFSAGEIVPDNAASAQVEPLSRDGLTDLHFTVQGFTNPLAWRLKPGWKLAVDHRALETTSGPKAVVLWAELTTVLRAEGPEWLRAVYHLQNRALQFLPLRLPEGLELVSVTVAETPVRADAGTLSDGKPGLLIPLIQTRPGDLAMDVEIVCRSRPPASGTGRRIRRLADPDIPGISIQRTLWNVQTPPGWELGDAGGNMEPVEEKKNLMEKLQADLEELDLLSSLTKSTRDAASRRNAQNMSGVLFERMRQQVDQSSAGLARGSSLGEQNDYQEAVKQLESARKLKTAIDQTAAAEESGPAQAPAGSPWVWSANSSYLLGRSRESGITLQREDSLVAGSHQINGGLFSGNTAVLAKNTAAKPGEPAVPQTAPAGNLRRYNNQISTLNGVVTFDDAADEAKDRLQSLQVQQFQQGQLPGRSEGRDVNAPASDRGAAQQEFNRIRGGRKQAAPAAGKDAPVPQSNSAPAKPLSGPAEGDKAGTITIRPEMPKPLFAGTPLPFGTAKPASATPAPTVQLAAPAPPAAPPPADAATARPDEPAAAPVLPAMPVLKPAGRVSIPITLPVEGVMHRFRKVNDGAALELTLTPVANAAPSRWLAVTLLGCGLVVLWLVNRFCRRRAMA